jgi:hypothetical protein
MAMMEAQMGGISQNTDSLMTGYAKKAAIAIQQSHRIADR